MMGYIPGPLPKFSTDMYNQTYNNRCAACEKEIEQRETYACEYITLCYKYNKVYLCINCFKDNAPDELIEMLGLQDGTIFSGPINKELDVHTLALQELAKPDHMMKHNSQQAKHFVNVTTRINQGTQYYCIGCNNPIDLGSCDRIPGSFKIKCNSCGAGIEEVYYHG